MELFDSDYMMKCMIAASRDYFGTDRTEIQELIFQTRAEHDLTRGSVMMHAFTSKDETKPPLVQFMLSDALESSYEAMKELAKTDFKSLDELEVIQRKARYFFWITERLNEYADDLTEAMVDGGHVETMDEFPEEGEELPTDEDGELQVNFEPDED